MNINNLLLSAAICVTLTACGGGGGGGSSNNSKAAVSSTGISSAVSLSSSSLAASSQEAPASSSSISSTSSSDAISSSSMSSVSSSEVMSSSSSSQSSSWVAVDCSFTSDGDVFIDKVCAGVVAPKVYEYTKTVPSTGGELELGAPTNLITVQVIDSEDETHHQVLDIAYNHAEYNGGVHLEAPAPGNFDLSEYATGSLQFDLKVIDRGDAQTTINYKVACGWPCESTEIRVTPDQLGQWQTITVPIADLVMRGLDLTKATTAIELLPTWDEQAGVHYQIDNIRWIKNTHTITTNKCFGQHTFANVSISLEDIDSGSEIAESWVTGNAQIDVTPNWVSPTQDWGFAVRDATNIPSCLTDATFSADVLIPKAYVDDGSMRVGLYMKDAVGNKLYFATTSVAGLIADDWNHLSADLTGVSDLSAMQYLGVVVYANGKPTSVTGKISIDNLVLSHAAD